MLGVGLRQEGAMCRDTEKRSGKEGLSSGSESRGIS